MIRRSELSAPVHPGEVIGDSENGVREVAESGVIVTALNASPELRDSSLSTRERNALEYPVLSDQGNKFARLFGIVYTRRQRFRNALPDDWTSLLTMAVRPKLCRQRSLTWWRRTGQLPSHLSIPTTETERNRVP